MTNGEKIRSMTDEERFLYKQFNPPAEKLYLR